MKKRFIIVVIILIGVLTGCANNSEITPKLIPPQLSHILEINKYYDEYYEIKRLGDWEYQYIIFDKNHEVIDSDVIDRQPRISMTHGLVKVCIGVGTGVRMCKYYDPNSMLISEWFENPIKESDTMVVYLDFIDDVYHLVVQDIFGKQKYFKGFAREFSHDVYPVTNVDFLYNGKQMRFTYKTGDDEKEVTEIVDLY